MSGPSHKELEAFVGAAARSRALFPRGGIEEVPGLTGAQLEVLVAVAAYPEHSTDRLAQRLGIHSTGITRALDALEERGFVETKRHATRTTTLTAQGQTAIDAFARHARSATGGQD